MKLNNFRDLEIELITWEDCTELQEAWSDQDKVHEWLSDEASGLCETVGYVIAEDEMSIVVSSTIMESQQSYSVVTRIPKGMIKKRIKWGEDLNKE